MHIRFLKIKLKALAAEARIIRREELRLNCSPRIGEAFASVNTEVRNAMHDHRVVVVRRVARATHLAYGFLRGRSYLQLEPSTTLASLSFDSVKLWGEVLRMVRQYGGRFGSEAEAKAALEAWRTLPLKKVA